MDAIKLMEEKFSLLLIRRSLVRVQQGEPEKTLVRKNKSFFSYIRLRRVILLRSDIRLTPSDIALRAVKGEYNITETVRFQYHFHEVKISLCA